TPPPPVVARPPSRRRAKRECRCRSTRWPEQHRRRRSPPPQHPRQGDGASVRASADLLQSGAPRVLPRRQLQQAPAPRRRDVELTGTGIASPRTLGPPSSSTCPSPTPPPPPTP